MDISELAQRQRIERSRAEVRRQQRNQSPMQMGLVTGLGDRPTVSIVGGAAVTAINMGGALRLGQVILIQSDGLNYWCRGVQSL